MQADYYVVVLFETNNMHNTKNTKKCLALALIKTKSVRYLVVCRKRREYSTYIIYTYIRLGAMKIHFCLL